MSDWKPGDLAWLGCVLCVISGLLVIALLWGLTEWIASWLS